MSLLAIALQDSPQSQPSGQQVAAMMAGFGLIFAVVGLVMIVFFVFLFWRIFTKAGMAAPLALLVIFPGIGPLIALCILAFGTWRVSPAVVSYAGAPLPPSYPPQNPPPGNYPPQQGY